MTLTGYCQLGTVQWAQMLNISEMYFRPPGKNAALDAALMNWQCSIFCRRYPRPLLDN